MTTVKAKQLLSIATAISLMACLAIFAWPTAAQTQLGPPMNVAQINGVTPLMGNGASGTGAQRVTLANDSTGILATVTNVATIGTSVTPGTAAANLGKAEDAGHTSADVGIFTLGVRKETNAQFTSADGEYSPYAVDGYGSQFVREDHPNRIHCTSGSPLAVSTATTLTVLNGCAAPGAGLSIYITDINFSTNAAGIAADTFNTVKYGTGGACGTGTNVIWAAFTTAAVQAAVVQQLKTPIKIPANNELCWINSTAGSKLVIVDGYIAP